MTEAKTPKSLTFTTRVKLGGVIYDVGSKVPESADKDILATLKKAGLVK